MRLKKKPVEPQRKKIGHQFDIEEGPISKVFNNIQEKIFGEPIEEPRIVIEYSYDNTEYFVYYQVWEDDSSFNERMHHYELKLAEYNDWYNTNKEEIDAEIEARKNKEQYKLDQKKKQLKAEMESLQRKMDRLNNANNVANTK